MQGIYKLLNKSKNDNTFYFELCSGCAAFAHKSMDKDNEPVLVLLFLK